MTIPEPAATVVPVFQSEREPVFPAFRSIRGCATDAAALAVEDWGIARFEVIDDDRSAHQRR